MKALLLVSFLSLFGVFAVAANDCPKTDKCSMVKKKYTEGKWKTQISKEFDFNSLCKKGVREVNIERDLGVEFWIYSGNPAAENPIERNDSIHVSIYTYKTTFSVASLDVPFDSPGWKLLHRLTPRGSSVVEVECFKK